MNLPTVPRQRKPDWIRVKAPTSPGYAQTRNLMRSLGLATVCEEAACPNIGECWTKKHATVMILGDTCTRACAFCNVKTGMPRAVDPLEPEHVAIAAAELGLEHIVITSVDRDDLPDGGASQFVKVIDALRRNTPNTTIEILTPDFRNKSDAAVEAIVDAGPDVYNHNLETVPRLYPTIRPARATTLHFDCWRVKRRALHVFTKSGVMVGLGEQRLEVHQVMDDMRSAGVDFLTMGQYLSPRRATQRSRNSSPAGVRRVCGHRAGQGLPARQLHRSRGRAITPATISRRCRRPATRNWSGRTADAASYETKHLPYTPDQLFDLRR